MSFPHDFIGWLALVFHLLVLFVPPTWLAWRLLSSIAAHSICLSGQRSPHKPRSPIWYRFAVQNNERISLIGKRKLTIAILDPAGRFLAEKKPRLFVGRNAVRAQLAPDLNVLTVEFDEIPAYDTWSIECETNEQARNLSLSIEQVADDKEMNKPSTEKSKDSSEPLLARPASLSHSRLTLYSDQPSAFEGSRSTPEFWWAATAVALALGGYCVVIIFGVKQLNYWDALPALLMVALGFALWGVIRRPAPSISQGYWTAIEVDSADPGESTPSGANAASA